MSTDVLDLNAPIQADRPCGENLDETPVMASFDAYQLFGQAVAPDPAPPWAEIKQRSLETLTRSKDIRILAHLAAASLRTDGPIAFFETLPVAARWLEDYWAGVYPLIDEDAIVRRNALSAFGDHIAVLDGLRRAILVSSRQHGRFSLRDVDIAAGNAQAAEGEEPADASRIEAAFATVPLAELTALEQAAAAAIAALKAIDARMRDQGGPDAAPAFERLLAQMTQMDGLLRAKVAAHPDSAKVADGEGGAAAVAGAGAGVGPVRSRQEAIRAMEAVAEFFRQTEPSSPIPMLLDRAVRLVSKSFLDVLADLAPDSVSQAKAAVGLRNE